MWSLQVTLILQFQEVLKVVTTGLHTYAYNQLVPVSCLYMQATSTLGDATSMRWKQCTTEDGVIVSWSNLNRGISICIDLSIQNKLCCLFLFSWCVYTLWSGGLQVNRSCASFGPEPMGVAWMDVKLSLHGCQLRRLASALICPQHLEYNTLCLLGALYQ